MIRAWDLSAATGKYPAEGEDGSCMITQVRSRTVAPLFKRSPCAISTDGDDVTIVRAESDTRDRERVAFQRRTKWLVCGRRVHTNHSVLGRGSPASGGQEIMRVG